MSEEKIKIQAKEDIEIGGVSVNEGNIVEVDYELGKKKIEQGKAEKHVQDLDESEDDEEMIEVEVEAFEKPTLADKWTDIRRQLESRNDFEKEKNLIKATSDVLEQEIKIENTKLIQKFKQENMDRYKKNKEEPATKAQKKYLDDLGVDYSSDISKNKASELIEKNVGKNNSRKRKDFTPATEKQKKTLRDMNAWEEGLSKSEASDKISSIIGD